MEKWEEDFEIEKFLEKDIINGLSDEDYERLELEGGENLIQFAGAELPRIEGESEKVEGIKITINEYDEANNQEFTGPIGVFVPLDNFKDARIDFWNGNDKDTELGNSWVEKLSPIIEVIKKLPYANRQEILVYMKEEKEQKYDVPLEEEERETKVIRKVLDNGKEVKALDIIDEFEDIKSEIESIELDILNSEDVKELETLRDELIIKRDNLIKKSDNWYKNASVMDKITVMAIDYAPNVNEYYVGAIGADYDEIITDPEVQANEDLMKKLNIFEEKCSVVKHGVVVTLQGKYKGDEFVCESIYGEGKVINSNARYALVDFKTGHIANQSNEIDESYDDPSIIMVDMQQEQNHDISEIEDAVSGRKTEDLNEVISEISEEMQDKSKENDGQTMDV